MSDTNDPFLVNSRLGITSVLRALMAHKALIHAHLGRQNQAIITTVLDVDTEQERFIIDAAPDDTFNQKLTQASMIHFDALVEKIRVQFNTAHAEPYMFEQRSALRLPYPDALRRLQRRDHYRIDIPVSMPLLCEIPVTDKSTPLKLTAKNISFGGVALADSEQAITDGAGSVIRQCVFELDDVGTVVTDLVIRRISDQSTGDANPVRVIACEFSHPSTANDILIQNYIGRLERLLNARRRGFD